MRITNPLLIEQRGSLWDGFHPNMCRSETLDASVYGDNKDTFFLRPEITIRPTAKLSFEFILQRLHEKQPDATEWELSEWTRRFVVNYQFAQRMYARASAEFTLERERRVFALFAYEYRPESNLFIVYNDNRDVEGDTERIVFIKISHLLKTDLF